MRTRAMMLALAAWATGAAAEDWDRHGRMAFEGRYIVSVSDADMVASAYVDGDLGPREGRDALSVLRLGGDPREWRAVEIEASRSRSPGPSVHRVS
ncbi:MAG: hypothetical protein AAFV49_14200, partial [Pseudomonadota bacterium]